MIQVGSVQYAANALNKEVKLNELDPENEIRRLRVQLEITLISTAVGAFAIAAGDHNTIASAIVARVKGSWNFDDNACNLLPSQLRTWTQDSQGADCQTEDLRVGDSVPGSAGTAIKKKLAIDIDFTHQGADTPNLACMSSDQFNASAAKLMLDLGTLPTAGGPLVLAAGTATTVVADIKVLAEYADAYGVFVGPHWTLQEKGEGKDRDVDLTPGIEWLLAQESDPTTFEGVFSQVNINIDERFRTRSVSPTTLALDYLRTSVKRDSLRGYDITRNSLGGTGSQVSPLRWTRAHVRSAEYELPFHNTHRRIEFTRVAGVAAAYLFLQVKTAHVSKVEEVIRRLMSANGVGGAPDSLRVRGFGGSENDAFRQFKGRWVKPRAA